MLAPAIPLLPSHLLPSHSLPQPALAFWFGIKRAQAALGRLGTASQAQRAAVCVRLAAGGSTWCIQAHRLQRRSRAGTKTCGLVQAGLCHNKLHHVGRRRERSLQFAETLVQQLSGQLLAIAAGMRVCERLARTLGAGRQGAGKVQEREWLTCQDIGAALMCK